LVPIWVLGLVTRGLDPFGFLLVLAANGVYVTFLATLGLWISTVSRNNLRAMLFTVLGALMVMVGPGYLVRAAGVEPLETFPVGEPSWSALLLEYGLTPPATVKALTFRTADLWGGGLRTWESIVAAVAGLHLYMAGTVVL